MAVAFSPRRLRTATATGQLAEVQALILGEGRSVDGVYSSRTGASLLYAAAAAGHCPVVAWLLSQHADVELARHDGATPLLAASSKGHAAVVAELIRAGADVNKCKASGTSPLCAAAQRGYHGVVSQLLDAGANVNLMCSGGFSALYKAAQGGHDLTAALLLSRGADADTAAPDGSTPLLTAAYIGNGPMVRLLADHRDGGECPEISRTCTAPDGRTFTALQAAVAIGHTEVVSILELAAAAPLLGARQRLAWAGATHRRLGSASNAFMLSADVLSSVAMVAPRPLTTTVERWDGRPGETGGDDQEVDGGAEGDEAEQEERRLSRFTAPILFGKYEHASPRPIPCPDTLTPLRSRSRSDIAADPWGWGDDGVPGVLSTSPGSVGSSGSSGDEQEDLDGCGRQERVVSLADLRGESCPDDVDPARKEDYLSEEEFRWVFKLTRGQFAALPENMQRNAKKQAGLCDPDDSGVELPAASPDDQADETQLRWWSEQLLSSAASAEAEASASPARRRRGRYTSPIRARVSPGGYRSPFRRQAEESNIFRTSSARLLEEGAGLSAEVFEPACARQLFDAEQDGDGDEEGGNLAQGEIEQGQEQQEQQEQEQEETEPEGADVGSRELELSLEAEDEEQEQVALPQPAAGRELQLVPAKPEQQLDYGQLEDEAGVELQPKPELELEAEVAQVLEPADEDGELAEQEEKESQGEDDGAERALASKVAFEVLRIAAEASSVRNSLGPAAAPHVAAKAAAQLTEVMAAVRHSPPRSREHSPPPPPMPSSPQSPQQDGRRPYRSPG